MGSNIISVWYFIIFFPMVYAIYNLLKIFDYEKILLRGKVAELKIVLAIISVGLSYLFTSSIIEIFERISNFF